ncbi:MAG: TolC family protein [Gemmatimonadota bacterium]|jgi:cobalt-zinc-cadmium efflux system outer membrane protein
MYRSILIAAAVPWVFGARGCPPLAAQTSHAGDTLVVSLAEARQLAVRMNPELRVSSWRPVAARGDIRSARTLAFNPDATFDARSPGTGFASRFEAEVGLELEVAGQRGLRVDASESAYGAASERFHDDGRLVLAEVERAYHHLVAAEQRQLLADEISQLNQQLSRAVATQLAEGEVSVLEANLASIEGARARARALEARGARTDAAIGLGRLLGLTADRPLRTEGPGSSSGGFVLGEAEAVDEALRSRPDLLAADLEVERARQAARVASREAFPNLRVAALATRENPALDPRLGVSIGLEIPLFDRNQGLSERRRAEIVEREAARTAAELRVRTEVENALRSYELARQEVETLEAEMLDPIRQNQGLLEIAFREGKIDLASLLLLRNQLLDAELAYWAAWERREAARTELASATGSILEGVELIEGTER